MFKQVFRLAFVALVWKQYKGVIVSTLLLLAFLLLVSNLHQDYLAHLALQENSKSAGVSFLFKWLAYAAGVSVYFLFFWWRSLRTPNSKMVNKTGKPSMSKAEIKEASLDAQGNDPFDEIRERKKLRGRGDFLDQA